MTAALVARVALSPVLGEHAPMHFLLPAVIVSAAVAGTGPAVLATAVGFVSATELFLPGDASLAARATIGAIFLLNAGAVIWFVASFRRASERREAAAALAEGREREFRSIFELASVGAARVELPSGRFLHVNRKLGDLTGYTEAELLAKRMGDLTHPDDRAADQELIRKALAGIDRDYVNEKRIVRKDGRAVWMLVNATVLFDESGTPRSAVALAVDVTQRREAQALLAESERRFRQIAESLEDVLWILEGEQLAYVSPAFEKLWGCPPDFVYSNVQNVFDTVAPEDRARMRDYLRRVLGGERLAEECRIVRPDGATRWICVRAFPVGPTHDGAPRRVVGIIEDTTEKKQMLDALAQAKLEAEVANKAKDAFLATMSHEFRTPLNAIGGYAELLGEAVLAESERAAAVATIRRNVEHLSQLVNDILDLAKIRAGKVDVRRQLVALAELLDDVASTLAAKARAKGLELRVDLDPAAPSRVRTDPLRLRQILVNLVANAIKFTDAGSVTLRVTPRPPRALELTVTDTGRGIAPDDAARLFRPFEQARKDPAAREGGTGLGLVLSRRLAQLLGGDVELRESRVGHGSTFVVTIEDGVAGEAAQPAAVGEAAAAAGPSAAADEHALAGIRVLLVEDSADVQRLFRRILTLRGADVSVAGSGAEATAQVREGAFDIVLMDLQLPDTNGFSVAARLRHLGHRRPIVALSGMASPADRTRSREAGCDEHLEKPVTPADLVATVARLAAPAGTFAP